MPRYDYDCAACGTRFEATHGIHADPPTVCPSCGGGPIKKAFAPPTIMFKGSGWAKKERRATAAPGAAKGATAEGATAEGATASTGDAKDGGEASPTSTTKPTAGSATAGTGTTTSGSAGAGSAGDD